MSTIVNILGEIVKESTINDQKNIIIDMSNYTSGVYFLILEDTLGTKQTTLQLILWKISILQTKFKIDNTSENLAV